MDGEDGKINVILASKRKAYDFDALSVTFEDPNEAIIDAVADVLLEEEGINIREDNGDGIFTLRKMDDTKTCYLFPKAVAG